MSICCRVGWVLGFAFLILCTVVRPGLSAGLDAVRERGVLRHIGVEPYANFVTSSQEGLSIEVIQRFAKWLGVEYQFVPTQWSNALGDLLGGEVYHDQQSTTRVTTARPVTGDVLCSGVTALQWRSEVVAFSHPTFLTQVLLVTRSDFRVTPIRPTGCASSDIKKTQAKVAGLRLMGVPGTCLDPEMYALQGAGAEIVTGATHPNQLVPRLLEGEVQAILLDVPSALMGLGHWPGQLKIIGPVSPIQYMACAFRPQDTALRQAFNRFMEEIRWNGTYYRMVERSHRCSD